MRNSGIYLLMVCCLLACKVRRSSESNLAPVHGHSLLDAVRLLKEEGFRTAAGRLPLEEQMAESWRYQREKDAGGEARNFVVSTKAKGNQYDAVRLQAESLAKVQLAGLMETRIGQIVTNRMETSDGRTRMNTVASSKNLVTTRLANLYPLMEIYRNLPDGEVEIQIVMGCDRRWASEIAWAVISADVTQNVPRHTGFSFTLTGLGNTYRSGDTLRFSLEASVDCYYSIFVFDADGVELLFPGTYEATSLFQKGITYTFPRTQWVAYFVEKSRRSSRFEQNILLVVATLKEVPFAGEATVDGVFGWLRQIPEEQRSERYFSFLSE